MEKLVSCDSDLEQLQKQITDLNLSTRTTLVQMNRTTSAVTPAEVWWHKEQL